MNHVAFGIEEDVSIMSIFDLQNVAQQTIASHRPHEVLLGCLVPFVVNHLLGNALSSARILLLFGCCLKLCKCWVRAPAIFLKGFDEVLPQCLNVRILLFKLVNGDSIRNSFNQASSWTSGNNIKGL